MCNNRFMLWLSANRSWVCLCSHCTLTFRAIVKAIKRGVMLARDGTTASCDPATLHGAGSGLLRAWWRTSSKKAACFDQFWQFAGLGVDWWVPWHVQGWQPRVVPLAYKVWLGDFCWSKCIQPKKPPPTTKKNNPSMPRWVSSITPRPSKNTFAGGYVEFPLFPVVPFGLLASRVFNSSSTWPFSGSTARPGARVCMHTNSTRGQALGSSPCNRGDFKSSFLGVCNA